MSRSIGVESMSNRLPVDKKPGSLGALTGLRFLAALLIVVEHSASFGLQLPQFGYDHGVSFFFVLSGFILTYVHPRIESRSEAGIFIWYRIARVWPAHFVMLLATIFILRDRIKFAVLPNLTLIHAWIPLPQYFFSYNAVSW